MTPYYKKLIPICAVAILVCAGAVYAEEGTNVEVNSSASVGTPAPKKGVLEAIKARMGIRVDVKNIRTETREDIKDIRKDMRGNASTTMQDMRNLRASTTEARKDMREDIKDRREEGRREIMGIKLRNRFDPMIERFDATISRLSAIAVRLESRITKVKNAGVDTTVSEKFDAEAKVHLSEARVSLTKMTALASTTASIEANSTTASTTLGAMIELRKVANETQKHIEEARKSLEKALGNLKGWNGKTATTTNTTN